MLNRHALNNIKNAKIRGYEDRDIWYAVPSVSNPDDWDNGSYDFIEACEMLKDNKESEIVIVDTADGFCLGEIDFDYIEEFL